MLTLGLIKTNYKFIEELSMAGSLLASFALFVTVYLSKPFVTAYSKLAEAKIHRKPELQLNAQFLRRRNA